MDGAKRLPLMSELEFYSTPGPMTGLGPHAEELSGAGADLDGVIETVQGLLIHTQWAQAYGVDASQRQDEVQARRVTETLDICKRLDDAPLTEAREPSKRALGNCRHFSTMAAALFRAAGRPARARCGFGMYFEAGKGIDHWVVEFWTGSRWRLADAQLDAFQREWLKIDFDPRDVPHDRFLVAGEAWRRCQAGIDDGANYGIFDMWGQWFIEGNIVRDLASLNKMELLPWDAWGVMVSGNSEHHRHDVLIDKAAEVSRVPDFDDVRALYEDDLLRVPDTITSFFPEETQIRLT